ncbi:MscS Mechanosensitive ion channel [Chloroherpeton thalassium ATCC 35110]|uniref:MscS Mechanosensitive ion channel n=1 Tax=Chloroherpeton thalassium (strain ATCC 35110 / GB-78) TaxID=517418 RepID=B3QUX7_CHLT3|nr:mechanosensitive ion channel family protein [Chloroherpeton thalassium]ACF14478.1 MscS Mechanosensitive ion channel [Chloroherpeton thalassium ATCC 35110]
MPKFFENPEISIWITGIIVAISVAISLMVFFRLLIWRLRVLAERTQNKIAEGSLTVIGQTKIFFHIAVAIYTAILFVKELPDVNVLLVNRLLAVAIIVQLGIWGSSLIAFWIANYRKEKLEQDAASVTTFIAIGFLVKVGLFTLLFLLILANFGIDVTALIAGLGVGGIAIALAVQNILGDLFASLSIAMDKPFVIGDFISVDTFSGTVDHIGLKTTRVKSISGEQIVFSNADLLGSRVRNFKRMQERRIVFAFGVTYETGIDKLKTIPDMVKEIIQAKENVRYDRVHFKEFGDFSLNYEVVYFVLVPEYVVYMDIQQQINLELYERFEKSGINFAYPTQLVYLNKDQ